MAKKDKHVKLDDEARILLNKAESKLLKADPEIVKVTDNLVIKTALKVYLNE